MNFPQRFSVKPPLRASKFADFIVIKPEIFVVGAGFTKNISGNSRDK
jgi:hypothetical protein